MSGGTIVVLNGPSSAGKTTLAQAVRAELGARCAALSIDQLFASLYPDARVDWPTFSALFDAHLAAAAVLADHGFDVIADTVFERSACITSTRRALTGHAHHLVAVTCDLAELEAREAHRGNRRPGLARAQHARVLHDATYALHLDTSRLSIAECVSQIVGLVASHSARGG